MGRLTALVVDSDAAVRARLQERLAALEIEARGAVSDSDASAWARRHPVDVLLVAPGSLLEACEAWSRRPVVVAMFAASSELAATGSTWLDRGADDLLALDAGDVQLDLVLKRSASFARQRERDTDKGQEPSERDGFGSLVGRSAALESIRERLERLSAIRETIWIEGERGVGKKWSARWLHQLTAKPGDPFVVLEAADLEVRGWEDRLLGSPGSGSRRTLYLAEPALFGPEVAEHLQRWILGFGKTTPAGLRIVSGSTLPLPEAVEQARLPQPLASRLAETRLSIPPLRERPEDVAPMALHFIRTIGHVNQLDPLRLSAAALDRLEAYGWPGNARELRHAIEHAAILADGLIELSHLPRSVRDDGGAVAGEDADHLASRPFREAKGKVVGEFEQAYLNALMRRERGNVTAAARSSGMLRSALQRLLRKYGLKSADFRRKAPAKGGPTPSGPHAD